MFRADNIRPYTETVDMLWILTGGEALPLSCRRVGKTNEEKGSVFADPLNKIQLKLCKLCEVLDCTNHLACVAVFVVIP